MNMKPYFIGIDSDGTAFDTMEIKHKRVFIPLAIRLFNLEAYSKEYTQLAEKINLYSTHRGINRFPGLLLSLQVLEERVTQSGVTPKLPDYRSLEGFVESGAIMSRDSLVDYISGHENGFLERVLEWSDEGDRLLNAITEAEGNLPYPWMEASLKQAKDQSYLMVVSSASYGALIQDWGDGGIMDYMDQVAGQEKGKKKDQLAFAVEEGYSPERCLMIGDALGDMEAAKVHGMYFYPIIPGREEASWKQFHDKVYQRFIEGHYGKDEEMYTQAFLKMLGQ